MEDSLAENIRIKDIYKILFICFVACGLYYPSIFSQFNSIDDGVLIAHLEDTDFNFIDLIIPGKSHYYRPVVWLTFFFDKYAWGLEPGFMHLENILIHAGNAVLVYLLAKRVYGTDEQRLELPLFAALLFAAHPINTEAVCWVAGRTDPLATLFILMAAWFLSGSYSQEKFARLIIPAGLIFLGCLAKEVAFFLFPPAYLSTLRFTVFARDGKFSWNGLLRPAVPFIFFALFYLYLRHIALTAGDRSVSILLNKQAGLIATADVAITAFGFYVKKLFLPLPLNFAIVSYSHNYIWLGAAVLLLLCWLVLQKKSAYNFLACSLFLTLPAVIISVKRVAWTPVAERYLYAPSAFFVIAILGILYTLQLKKKYEQLLPAFLTVIVILSAYFTAERNLVWQDNYLLFKDAVKGSPQFARIRNEYGISLGLKGDQAEAVRQFEAGKQMDKSYPLPVLNLANMKFKEGKTAEALKILSASYKGKSDAQVKTLILEARIYESLLFKTTNNVEKRTLILELIDNYNYICRQDADPYLYYRSGQLLLFIDEPEKAALLFARAFKEAPENAFYKQAAKKLADKLSKK